MDMVKLTKRIHILFLSFGVVLLWGCSGEQKQVSSADTAANLSVRETTVKQANPAETTAAPEPASPENDEAKQKLAFAENNMKMAKKGILNYSQSVVICRGIIRDYPNTEYEQQARQLLREVPEDLRSQYNLSDQELGF
jgi:hypothetical protein